MVITATRRCDRPRSRTTARSCTVWWQFDDNYRSFDSRTFCVDVIIDLCNGSLRHFACVHTLCADGQVGEKEETGIWRCNNHALFFNNKRASTRFLSNRFNWVTTQFLTPVSVLKPLETLSHVSRFLVCGMLVRTAFVCFHQITNSPLSRPGATHIISWPVAQAPLVQCFMGRKCKNRAFLWRGKWMAQATNFHHALTAMWYCPANEHSRVILFLIHT